MRDITLKNITIHDAILPPGIVRCNETHPCTEMVFENVQADGWWRHIRANYFVDYAYGTVTNSHPKPRMIQPDGDGFVGDDHEFQMVHMFAKWVESLFKGETTGVAQF